MPELAAELAAATGEKADPASLSRRLIRAGYRFKKKFCAPASTIVPTSNRRAKNGPPFANMRLEPDRLVFVDETGTTTKMTCLRGRCPTGQGFSQRPRSDIGRRGPSSLACDAARSPRLSSSTRRWTGASSRLTSKPNWLRPSNRAMSSSWITCPLIKGRPPRRPFAPRALGSYSCRPQQKSNRDGFRKAQGPAARQSDQDHRRPLASHRRNPRSLHSPRMPKLLHPRRLRIHMKVRRLSRNRSRLAVGSCNRIGAVVYSLRLGRGSLGS